MSFHRNDVVITHHPDGSTLFEVGSNEEWTYYSFKVEAEDMADVRNLKPFESMKCRSGDDKLYIYYFDKDGANKLLIEYKEKMPFSGYETDNIQVSRTEL